MSGIERNENETKKKREEEKKPQPNKITTIDLKHFVLSWGSTNGIAILFLHSINKKSI